jgi:hypothetical protein
MMLPQVLSVSPAVFYAKKIFRISIYIQQTYVSQIASKGGNSASSGWP